MLSSEKTQKIPNAFCLSAFYDANAKCFKLIN